MPPEGIALTKVSVVVSTYSVGRFDYLLGCIGSLKRQTLQPNEIILVLDKDKALLDFYELHMPTDVKIVVSSGFGLSNARNAGVKNAEGEIVAFIDDDAIADGKWLENLAKNYEDPLVLGVGGLIKPLWESKRPGWFPEELYWIVGCSYKGLPENKSIIRNPIGCNMSFRKSVFEKAGYFNTDIGRTGKKLVSNEDTEFSIRVWEKIADAKIVYDPTSIVCHKVPKSRASLKYVIKRSFSEGVSKAIVSRYRSNPTRTLHVEQNYLRHLLSYAIPKRLLDGHKPDSFLQILTLLLSTALVLLGYAVKSP